MSWAPGRAGSRVTPDGRPKLPPTPSRGPECTHSRTSTTEILNIIVLCNILRSRCLHNITSIMLRIGPRGNCSRLTNVARRFISPPGLGANKSASLRPRSGLCLAHLYSLKPAALAAVSLLWRHSRRRGDVDRARSLMAACGHQSPQHTASSSPHSTNAVARSECPTTKRLPLPLAYSRGKISAKRGMIKSLEIPNM